MKKEFCSLNYLCKCVYVCVRAWQALFKAIYADKMDDSWRELNETRSSVIQIKL